MQEWDLEAGMPTATSWYITCTDAGGLPSSKTITSTVAAINEFTPLITPTSMTVAVSILFYSTNIFSHQKELQNSSFLMKSYENSNLL